jgi:hypothetical protein
VNTNGHPKDWRGYGKIRTNRNIPKGIKIQKRAIRLIANISNTSNCKPYFKKLKIMTLPVYTFWKFLHTLKGL